MREAGEGPPMKRHPDPVTEAIAVRLPVAAKLIGMSERALWEKARRGEVPSFMVGAHLRLFEVEALRKWVRDRASLPSALPSATPPPAELSDEVGAGRNEAAT